ncbi:cyanoexosortase A system-associated protein [Chlorogloeopsis sp. ULAP01]|uniref:cyanoexosortase A system-associated protein n=1 Tax=Chlorogloeopsis sp. ULAP01 TaxID=3056483 RepID=UPI0025AA4CBC|nr:cyanoexosortase A system-associated protein [Chlorogloeopsis sp. ULAP01]MDM9383288.1 cyanoexosortase A system-associated protein [Chlorogloeopsis sp. ULAP01]
MNKNIQISKINNQGVQSSSFYFKHLPKSHLFYILGIFSTLAILHLSIINSHEIEREEIAVDGVYWTGILFLLWQNRHHKIATNWIASCLGLGLLFLVIFRPLYLWRLDLILFRFGPIVAGLGLGLLSFGFSGLKQHWRLFLLLCLMLFPFGHINNFFASWLHFSDFTATISAFSLHYLGLQATAQGAFVILPTGQVEVLYYCTGGLLIVWLLRLSLLIMVVVFPLSWQQRWGLVISAMGTGFLVGCFRVALLAVVVNNRSIFEYWHSYTGGSIFIAIATITYAALCNWILPLEYLSPLTKECKPATTATVTPKRGFFLAATWVGMILTAIYLITNKRLLTTSLLPDQLALNSWQQVNVKPLIEQQKDTQDTVKSTVVLSRKDYSYLKNTQQLKLQMRYVVNTRGEPNPFLEKLSENLIKNSQQQPKYVKGVGFYTLYSDSKQAYLTACINPRGGSTVTSAQFMQNRYKYDLVWNRILPWVLGKEVLRDDRCIWAQLSLPLNGVSASNIYLDLEAIWSRNYTAWQSLFINKID